MFKRIVLFFVLIAFARTQVAMATYVYPPYEVTRGGTQNSSFTANLPLIGNGTGALAQGTLSGNTTEFATTTGTLTSGDCVKIDANGNFIDNGSACSASSGTVTNVSVVSTNGFAGTVATSTTTPAITIETTVTGILYGNGTSVAAAIASNFPTLNQNTTGSAASLSQSLTSNAVIIGAGTGVSALGSLGSSGQVLTSAGAGNPPAFSSTPNIYLSIINGGDTAYSIAATDGHIRSGTTLTANRTYTLDACTTNVGERHVIKNLPSQSHTVTVAGNGSDTVDGGANYVLNPGDSVSVICAVSGAWDIE